ncbi:MAG: hypothetical protein V1672_00860 [Candidatus Diapherotrites archaeon]
MVYNQEKDETDAVKRFELLIGLIEKDSLKESHLEIEKSLAGAPFKRIYDELIEKFKTSGLTHRDLVIAKSQTAIVAAQRRVTREKLEKHSNVPPNKKQRRFR